MPRPLPATYPAGAAPKSATFAAASPVRPECPSTAGRAGPISDLEDRRDGRCHERKCLFGFCATLGQGKTHRVVKPTSPRPTPGT
eukprot:scaffold2436_cov249-Pinguiococcus_pyrenoidosus.AAC.5